MLIFTRQERQVLLFLIIVALLGLGINFLSKHCSSLKIIGYINQDIGKIDLNRTCREELMSVTGIGKVLAQRIIDFRQQKRLKAKLKNLI